MTQHHTTIFKYIYVCVKYVNNQVNVKQATGSASANRSVRTCLRSVQQSREFWALFQQQAVFCVNFFNSI